MITIETSDGKQYHLTEEIICQSNLIKNMLSDLEIKEGPIPLPNITSSILDLVIRYAEMHQDDQEYVETDKDRELVNLPHQLLFDLVLAANYLDYPQLLQLGCRRIANMLKDMSIDQVQEQFNVPREQWYTPEERALIEQELKWANGS